MSSSKGEFEPSEGGDAAGTPVSVDDALGDGDNVFEVSVEAGNVVTADTSDVTASGRDALAMTDPEIELSGQPAPLGGDAAMAFDATQDAIAFDATMDEMSFNAAMDEAAFEQSNNDLAMTATAPELPAPPASDIPAQTSGFGAVTEPVQSAPPGQDDEVLSLRRQLDSARSELRIVVSQLNDLEKIRSYALQRSSEILMLKARQVSLESEVDLYRELTEEFRADCQGMEVRLCDAQGMDDGLGLAESDAEISSLREALAEVTQSRDEAREEAAKLSEDLATLRESDSRAPLLARIQELEAEAASSSSGDHSEEHAQLEARAHSLQAELFKAQSDATDASQRADRLKIALERLRQAFVRTAEQSERVPDLEAEIETLKTDLSAAQSAPPESAAAKRIEELERELAEARAEIADMASTGVGQGAEFQAQIDALTMELETAQSVASGLGDAGDAAAEVVTLRRKTTDLELQVSELTRQLEETADRVASAAPTGAQAGESDKLERLRIAVQRSSAQVQRLLLELEGSRGSVQRARRDMQRYSRSINALHEALNHLERYLIGAGPQAQQGVILLQEVKRCAHDVRAMVESNDRFGRSMSKVVERLSAIVSEA